MVRHNVLELTHASVLFVYKCIYFQGRERGPHRCIYVELSVEVV